MKPQIMIAAVCAALCLLTACAGQPASSVPGDPSDTASAFPAAAAGATVTAAPMRVAALAPCLVDTLWALSAESRLCAAASACLAVSPDGVTDIGDQYALDTDRLTALNLDLVLTLTMTPELAAWQKAQKVPVAVFDAPADLDGLRRLNADVAVLIWGNGSGEYAETANRAVEDGLAAVSEAIPHTDTPKTVLYLPDDSGAVATGDTLWQLAFDVLRLDNAAASGTAWQQPEGMKAPDIVLTPADGTEAAKKRFPSAAVVTVPEEIALRGGAAFSHAVLQLAQTLYPDRFDGGAPESGMEMSETDSAAAH